MKKRTLFALGLGLALAFGFSLLSAWANLEALAFESQLKADAPLRLSCPPFITLAAPAQISTQVRNSAAQAVRRTLRFTVTQGSVFYTHSEETIFDLQPGETRRFTWQAAAEGAAWGRFVMARAYLFRAYPDLSASSACGIFLLPLPFLSGDGFTLLWLLLSAALTVWGGLNMLRQGPTPGAARAVIALMGLALLAALASLMGWLALQFIACLTALLLLLSLAERRLQGG